MPNEYDGYYPQYQFASGGLMQALSPNQAAYDPKFLQNSLLQKLFEDQTKQQILNAFTPGGGTGGAPGGVSAPGGLSFLEQLLASTPSVPSPAPVGPSPVAPAPVPTPAPTDPKKKRPIMNDGGGMVDRGGYGGLGMSGY